MISQTRLILNGKWDNLIILDACRYDYFEKIYNDYLSGELIKVKSPASCTSEWLKKTWKEKHNYTYISGNPYINSKGIPCYKYIASHHFKQIIDVWKYGWNEELGTVHPEEINTAVTLIGEKKNLIIHYAQPHYPYIGNKKILFSGRKQPEEQGKPLNPIRRKQRRQQKLTSYLRENVEILKDAYIDNLKLVLSCVKKIILFLDGNIIVTSDHGDALCDITENRKIVWHPCNVNHPILTTVPWLEVIK